MTATAEPPNRPEEPISRRSSNWVWMAAGAGAAALTVVVLWGGYSHRWRWTGINGKTATLWDWLLPLLLPLVIVPALKPVATAGLTDIEDERTGELRAETAAAEPRPPFDQAPTVGDTGPALAGDP